MSPTGFAPIAAEQPQADNPSLRLARYNGIAAPTAGEEDSAARIAGLLSGRRPAAVARMIGMHPETVRRYMRGATPSAEFVRRLCLAFGVSADWLLCGRVEGPNGSLMPATTQSLAAALESAASRIRSENSSLPTPPPASGVAPEGWIVLPLFHVEGCART